MKTAASQPDSLVRWCCWVWAAFGIGGGLLGFLIPGWPVGTNLLLLILGLCSVGVLARLKVCGWLALGVMLVWLGWRVWHLTTQAFDWTDLGGTGVMSLTAYLLLKWLTEPSHSPASACLLRESACTGVPGPILPQ